MTQQVILEFDASPLANSVQKNSSSNSTHTAATSTTDSSMSTCSRNCPFRLSSSSSVSSFSAPSPDEISQLQRKVTFQDSAFLVSYDSQCDEDNFAQVWYSDKDFEVMRKAEHKMIKFYRNQHDFASTVVSVPQDNAAAKKGDDDDDDWTWRGFEHILHRLPRKLTRREHASNVIAFQKSLQQDFEIQDQEGNAMTLAAYAANSTFTNGGEARAQSQAIQDEREATDYEETVVVVEEENCGCFSQRKEGLIKTSKRAPSKRWGKMKKIFRC